MAKGLAEAGADVVCHARNEGDADETCAYIDGLGRKTAAVVGDMSDKDVPRRIANEAIEKLGRIDILVNNAGMIRRAPAVDYSEEDWSVVPEVNLSSIFRLSQAVGRAMIEQGRARSLISPRFCRFRAGLPCRHTRRRNPRFAGLTKLANEWAKSNINVNAIAPGYMTTKNTAALWADETRNRQILERIPAGRWGDVEDLVGAAVFLSSSASDYVNGHILAVDGGWLAR